METYRKITLIAGDGSRVELPDDVEYKIDYERDIDLGWWNDYSYRPHHAKYTITSRRGSTKYIIEHPGEVTMTLFSAEVWWVEFYAGDKWEKASQPFFKLQEAKDAKRELEKSTEGFVYRIEGATLGPKDVSW